MNATIDKQKYIFGRLFLLANKSQVIGDRVLGNEMTIRQWLLTAAVAQLGDSAPTLGEAARILGSSHQNVKQLAVKLRDKGYITLEKDEKDIRITRLRLTEKNSCFWERSRPAVKDLLNEIFCDFSAAELNIVYQCFNKLYEGIRDKELQILKGCNRCQ